MAMYIQLAKDSAGIEMIWDPSLSIEEARKLKQ
jgi:hypothetical protein